MANWDQFVENSVNGTLFHRRDFLQYHRDRFSERERYLVIRKGSAVVGQISYLIDTPDKKLTAVSPYGGSYGGIVLQRSPTFSEATDIVDALLDHFAQQGLSKFRITPPLSCCATVSLNTFDFALLRGGFEINNRDISNVVSLASSGSVEEIVTSRARNMARKAKSLGVDLVHKAKLSDFWVTCEATFSRHKTSPTHTLEELQYIEKHLGDHIWFSVAYHNSEPVAGICHFAVNSRVVTTFYLTQTDAGKATQALSALVMQSLEMSKNSGFNWCDFGTSSFQMEPRANLFRFKESFGAHGIFRNTFEWRHQA